MAELSLPPALPGERPLELKELMQRAGAMRFINHRDKANLCASMVHIGIFFDGTNNNKTRDQEEPLQRNPPGPCSHSNVVVLHDTFKNDPENGYYRYYIPGIGTEFEEVKESAESTDGKAKGKGGDARINWALIQVLNSMHRALHAERFIPNVQATKDATSAPLHSDQTDNNLSGKRAYLNDKLSKLERALTSKPPRKINLVSLSVFGFSRGAAEARAFCFFLHKVMKPNAEGGGYTLAGVPFRIQFLGVFDTVASVGMANASPFWRGLGGWANGTQDVAASVERTVHFCAAHEIRFSFPLNTVRVGNRKTYPKNCYEVAYPGSHSDVGGGYAPGEQGKALGSRSKLLSQIPLLHMYREACKSAVPFLTITELKANSKTVGTADDFTLDPETARLYNAYCDWSKHVYGTVQIEQILSAHMQLYWLWRLKYADRIKTLRSYPLASPQDQIDIVESNSDFVSDMVGAVAAEKGGELSADGTPSAVTLSNVQADFLNTRLAFAAGATKKMPELVDRFFDELVHDSHASFYMAGPSTAYDRKQKLDQIEKKMADSLKELRVEVGSVGCTIDRKKLTVSLSELERRIYDYQLANNGAFPLISDKDREQLLAMEDLVTSGAVRLVTNNTRRELGGHVHYRDIFDRS